MRPATITTIAPLRLYVIRHGERMDNVDPSWRRTAKRPHDPPLTATGKCMGHKLGTYLAQQWLEEYNQSCPPPSRPEATTTATTKEQSPTRVPEIAVVSSPLIRCVQTAHECVEGMEAVFSSALSNTAQGTTSNKATASAFKSPSILIDGCLCEDDHWMNETYYGAASSPTIAFPVTQSVKYLHDNISKRVDLNSASMTSMSPVSYEKSTPLRIVETPSHGLKHRFKVMFRNLVSTSDKDHSRAHNNNSIADQCHGKIVLFFSHGAPCATMRNLMVARQSSQKDYWGLPYFTSFCEGRWVPKQNRFVEVLQPPFQTPHLKQEPKWQQQADAMDCT